MNKGKVGEWVRHTSSSGKEYYFHVTKQISQWEKPREWIEYEKKHGPVPNAPSSSSAKPNPNKVQQSQQHHQQQSHNASTNHVNTSSSSADQRDRDRKSHLYQQQQQQHHGQQQQQQQHHYNTSHNSSNNSLSNYVPTSTPIQHQPVVASSSSSSSSAVHHHSHANFNNNGRPSNSESTSSSFLSQSQHHLSTSSISGRSSLYNDVRHPSTGAMSAAALRDTRKPSEDLQAEDMDISPLDDSNSPVSTDSKSMVGIGLNAHPHPNSQGLHYQSQYHPHHYSTSKNLQDGHESSREDAQRNSNFHHQHPNSGRLMHSGSSSSIGNNGYHGRDRDRDMRDSPRRLDNRDSRDYRDKDSREYRDYRDNRDKDSRDRDRGDRDRLRRDRDARDSPRRHDRDRNDRDRDHRSRARDRDHRDGRLRNRSGSKLRDERSRSPRERDSTPERHPGGDATGVSGLGSLGALAALNTDTETTPLPASLAQYFRQDLIAHVQDLPGDELERQANKLSDEIMTTSSIQLSKVSSDLKMARSLVRLTDIQATLQEQRILFLRQQIKNLEDSDRDNSSSMLGVETGDS